MRHIAKQPTPPPSLAGFLQVQLPVGVNLDYDQGFTRKPQLRRELVAEQFGLCGYTGAPIDERLASLAPISSTGTGQTLPRVSFEAHTEHLKPQSTCRQELVARGKRPGIDLGEDMDHRNMIAALLVKGAEREQFGAAVRGDTPVPVWPTHPGCDRRFRYHRNGGVEGRDSGAKETVEVLKLHHGTLCGWRQAALDVFLDPSVVVTHEDLRELISRIDQPRNGKLAEYSFVVRSVAVAMLGED